MNNRSGCTTRRQRRMELQLSYYRSHRNGIVVQKHPTMYAVFVKGGTVKVANIPLFQLSPIVSSEVQQLYSSSLLGTDDKTNYKHAMSAATTQQKVTTLSRRKQQKQLSSAGEG